MSDADVKPQRQSLLATLLISLVWRIPLLVFVAGGTFLGAMATGFAGDSGPNPIVIAAFILTAVYLSSGVIVALSTHSFFFQVRESNNRYILLFDCVHLLLARFTRNPVSQWLMHINRVERNNRKELRRMFELFGAIWIAPYIFMFAAARLILVAFWQGIAEEPYG